MSIHVYDFDVVGYAVDECRQVAHGIHVGFAVLLVQFACLLSADADLAQAVFATLISGRVTRASSLPSFVEMTVALTVAATSMLLFTVSNI